MSGAEIMLHILCACRSYADFIHCNFLLFYDRTIIMTVGNLISKVEQITFQYFFVKVIVEPFWTKDASQFFLLL